MLILGSAVAWAQVSEADTRTRLPQRWALIIANDDYTNIEPKMPSAIADGKGMAEKLGGINFKVTTVSNLKNFSAFDKALKEFARKVSEDDLVVVYFSGHGFIYNGSNYMVGTSMPQPMSKGDILKFALPSETITDYFDVASPGAVVLLVDACRSLGAVKTAPGTQIVEKGSPNQISGKGQFFMGLATRDGATAAGFGDASHMSIYTNAIVAHLAKEDTEFKDVYQDISVKVLLDSTKIGEPQQPGVFGYWNTMIYINPTQRTFDRDKELWLSVLNEKKPDTVEAFIARNALSPYVRAAKAWLERNGDSTTAQSYSRVSPSDVEQAYGAAEGEAAEVARPRGPFAFDRLQNTQGDLAMVVPTDGNVIDDSQLRRLRRYSTIGQERIVLNGVIARSSPELSGDVVGRLAARDRVVLKEVVEHGSETWARIELPNIVTGEAYVKFEEKSEAKVSLGHPIGTFILPSQPGNSSMVSSEALNSALAEVKKRGKTITWASLSTGRSLISQVSSDRLLQLAHAKYLLNKQNVSNTAITSVAGSPDMQGDGVRVKLFGY
ncbi:caspase family protein [Rhizobium sp. RSm-3]|nr:MULTISPECIES: caspase family protein [unclassified Rhizobium]